MPAEVVRLGGLGPNRSGDDATAGPGQEQSSDARQESAARCRLNDGSAESTVKHD
jgi:hypothetical protein